MATPFFNMMTPPPHWRVFESLLRELDDEALRIDPVSFMEAIGPTFLQHANATMPRRIRKPLGGKRSDAHITHYVLSHGRHRGGPYAYRIVSIDSFGRLNIADTTRLPDESDVFGRQAGALSGLSKLMSRMADPQRNPHGTLVKYAGHYADLAKDTSTYDGLFDGIFERFRLLDRVVKRVRSSAAWVSDLRFIEDTNAELFYGNPSSREAVVKDMLKSAEDIIGTRADDLAKRDFIKRQLMHCLEAFDAEMGRAATTVLEEIKDQIDQEAMELMAVNPSGITSRNYALLTRSKKPEALPLWRAVARACPIILLLRDRLLRDDDLLKMAEGGFNPDTVITHFFGVTDPKRIAFYKGLTETNVGLHNAERLRYLSGFLEKLDGVLPDPQTPEDWDTLATLIDAAAHIAMIVDRDRDRVLRDLILSDERDPAATIQRHFSMKDGKQFSSILHLRDWKDRIVASVLVPKLMVESQKRNINIPLHHLFYMVAGHPSQRRDVVQSINKGQRRVIEHFRSENSFLGQFFEGVSASRLLDTAFSFATHKLDWDAALKDRILSNRLFENGIQYPFPSLPEVRELDEFDTVSPIRGMDELLKECLDLRDFSIMNMGHLVAKDPIHFVTVRGMDAKTRAIACLEEPSNPFDSWKIRTIVTDPAPHRNASARNLVERYIGHETFLKHADVEKLKQARAKLREALFVRAKDRELMGFKVGNISERRGMLEALHPYIKVAGGWQIDSDGCLDAPKINAMVGALLRDLKPHYPRLAA